MDKIVKVVGTLVVTLVILGLPALTCLSFALAWNVFLRLVLSIVVIIEAVFVGAAVFVWAEVYERSEDE